MSPRQDMSQANRAAARLGRCRVDPQESGAAVRKHPAPGVRRIARSSLTQGNGIARGSLDREEAY